MGDKKWIFIENSLDTVRYKVGDSDSSVDMQDFEYLPDSPPPPHPPSVFEFIPPKKEAMSSGDELEIHDNHFHPNSCPTSDMDDSDIEVVMKSPSSSETASLCSLLSLHSNEQYKEIILNAEMSEKMNSEDDEEEEDSEVEVIGRSIHGNGSIKMLYVEEGNVEETSDKMFSSSGSENENEADTEESTPTYRNASFEAEDEAEEQEEECRHSNPDTRNDFNYAESIEDYGIKYLFEDLHVSRQINGRLVGLKTSTFVLTVCLSVTLGVYLGNYWNPMSNSRYTVDEDDILVTPDDVLNSNSEHPRRSVNITFKYSASTKESLRSVLNSFQQLKQDYDRLHVAFLDLKERCYLKKQMTFYWRKQLKKMEQATNDDIPTANQPPDAMLSGVIDVVQNGTCQVHTRAIRKLSSDFKREHKAALYWRKMYSDADVLEANTCPKYQAKPTAFSFSDCFNIFSKVIPKLGISVMNITKPAGSLAHQVHNAWRELKNRWNVKGASKDDPIYLAKVDRFRKIFLMSNLIKSDNLHRFASNAYPKRCESNTSNYNVQSDVNTHHEFPFIRKNMGNISSEKVKGTDDVEPCGVMMDLVGSPPVCFNNDNKNNNYNNKNNKNNNNNNNSKNKNRTTSYYDYDYTEHLWTNESIDELNWLRKKHHESFFLFDILKWQSDVRNRIDLLKTRRIDHLTNINKQQSNKIDELRSLDKENVILKYKIMDNVKKIREQLDYVKTSAQGKCSSSIGKVRRSFQRTFNILQNVHSKARKEEKSKCNRKLQRLLTNEKRKHNLSWQQARRSLLKKEQAKFEKKLRKMRKSCSQSKKSKYTTFDHKNKRPRGEKTRIYHHTNGKDHQRKKPIRISIKGARQFPEYSNNVHRSVEYTTPRLREMYDEVVKRAVYQEGIMKTHEDEVKGYKEMIEEYKQKLNEMNKEKNEGMESVFKTLINHQKILRENARLKRSVVTLTARTSNEDIPLSHMHMNKNENDERTSNEDMPLSYMYMKKNENTDALLDATKHSVEVLNTVVPILTSSCYKDADYKPFYNINDVYSEGVLGRNADINPTVPSRSTHFFPGHKSLPFSDQREMHISKTLEEKLFYLPGLSGNLEISGRNESVNVDEESRDGYLDKGSVEFNDDPRNEKIARQSNWYINWMSEKHKEHESGGPKKGGFWYWNAMKEREKLRSYNGEENWFLKAMKEREKLRFYESEENWFLKAMRNREKLRNEEGEEELEEEVSYL